MLVRSYRLVRHPLYVCEILSALAMMISNGRLATIALVAVFCGLQVTRIHYEESLLSKSFPEWRGWGAGGGRPSPRGGRGGDCGPCQLGEAAADPRGLVREISRPR